MASRNSTESDNLRWRVPVSNAIVPAFPAMTRRIAFILFPGFQIIDAAGPIGAFEIAARFSPGAYSLDFRAPEPGEIESSSGARMIAGPLGAVDGVDTVIVVGGEGSRTAMLDERLTAFVRRAAACRRIASVCTGAYVLAAAGLLDGRRATTHWRNAPAFAARFPNVKVDADRIWVRDGDIWTSAGITAGIDLALALIGDDLGEAIALRTAQQLVVYHRRPGGQSQFSALLQLDSGAPRFAALLEWARENLAEPLTVEHLAERVAMSPRNFSRAFGKATGVTPAKAVERLRLEAARECVEASSRDLDHIARLTGFADPERMRRAFIRAFGLPPQALRRMARAA